MKKLVKNEWFKIPGADGLNFYILQNANKKFTLLVSAEGEKLDKLVSLDEIIKDQTGLNANIANTTLSAISTFVKQYEKKLESRNQPEETAEEPGVITLDREEPEKAKTEDVVEDQPEEKADNFSFEVFCLRDQLNDLISNTENENIINVVDQLVRDIDAYLNDPKEENNISVIKFDAEGGINYKNIDPNFESIVNANYGRLRIELLLNCYLCQHATIMKKRVNLAKKAEAGNIGEKDCKKLDVYEKELAILNPIVKLINDYAPILTKSRITELVLADIYHVYPEAFTIHKKPEDFSDFDHLLGTLCQYGKLSLLEPDNKSALKEKRDQTKHRLYNFFRDFFRDNVIDSDVYSVKVNNTIINQIMFESIKDTENDFGTRYKTYNNESRVRSAIIKTMLWYGNGGNIDSVENLKAEK